jgi:DNA-binding response OmpR family regulator
MKKIVIVDDEPNIVMTLEYAFRKAGFDVYIARDGQEALDLLVNTIPDVIMLDIMMPQVDGFATLEQIRLNDQLNACKVVFLTAKNKASDIQKGLDLGADLYLTKPFSIKKVIEQVQELLA